MMVTIMTSLTADFSPSPKENSDGFATTGTDAHWRRAQLKIAMLVDRPSATQEVHFFRPLRRLRKAGECALCIWSEDVVAERAAEAGDWIGSELDLLRPDVLVFSRYAGQQVEVAISEARARGIPIITHLDDFLLDVPVELGAGKRKHHMQPERISALKSSLKNADLLYISTQALAQKVKSSGFEAPAVVSRLQSCADPEEICSPPYYDPEGGGPVRIGYQGTSAHFNDLQMIAPQLVEVMNARADVRLTLFGNVEMPPELGSLIHRVNRVDSVGDYATFLKTLCDQKWDIGLAPLRHLEFNSFRTYTKWTEYSIAGICVIATDCPVYKSIMAGGAGLLVDNDTWREGLLHLIDRPLLRREMVDASQERLRDTLTLKSQENQLLEMFESVIR
jgi:hypothetical protein